jgi:hypothetical protein
VVSELAVMLREAVGVEILDRFGDGRVELLAPFAEQAVVGDVLDDGVLEDVGRLAQQALLVDDLERFELLEQPLELAGQPRDPLEQPH